MTIVSTRPTHLDAIGSPATLPDRAKRNMAYTKPAKTGMEQGSLLAELEDMLPPTEN